MKKIKGGKKMEERVLVFRHGDIGLVPVDDSEVTGELVQKGGSYVLAEGEVTGHKHILTSPDFEIFWDKDKGIRYLKIETPAIVTHQEHGTRTIKKVKRKSYLVIHEREWDPFGESIRRTAD